MPPTVCDEANVKAYESGCLVSTCKIGWNVSDDKTKCVANTCSCPKGTAAAGAKCVTDGAEICDRCNAGFKLDRASGTCTGMPSHHCDS